MTRIGRYEIVDSLGAGSMGTVYRARDTILDRDVALKTIRTGAEVEPELRERFYREAKACARLQHPGIVSVFDMGEADHTAYISMELLEGEDFRKAIDQRTCLTLEKRIDLLCQVCDALAHAHRHGIIHRDIKPSNLFLLTDYRAKVLDFGIARLPSSHLTVAGQILGTPNYMAPEQILSKPADTRSDLFSAAVVFFEFLVFVHPFKSPMIPRRVVEGDPDSLMDYDSSLPPQLDRVLSRALAKDPDQRYRSVDDLSKDLRAVLDFVQRNSSPSFSLQALPSDREIRPEPPPLSADEVDLTLVKPVPDGEDAHEWRLSEVLRLVPELEDAVDRKNITVAQRSLREIEAINAVDSRFTDAVAFCRTLLAKLADETKTLPLPHPPAPAPAPVIKPPEPVAPALSPTQFSTPYRESPSVQEPQSSLRLSPQPLPRPSPEPMVQPSPAPPPPAAAPLKNASLKQPMVPSWLGGRTVVVSLSAAAALLAAIIGVRIWMRQTVPLERSVATGIISAPRTAVCTDSTGTSEILELSQGQHINVLELPASKDQEWIRVQFVPEPGKPSRAGYLRVRDLGLSGLETGDATSQLALIRMFFSNSTDPEAIPRQEAALKALIDRYPSKPEASQAELELASLELTSAKAMKDGGQPESAWKAPLDNANKYLELAQNDPSLKDRVEAMRKDATDMAAAVKPPPPVSVIRSGKSGGGAPGSGRAKDLTPAQIKESLDQAETLLRLNAEIPEALANAHKAEDIVKGILAKVPDDSRAQVLMRNIESKLRVLGQ